MEGWNIRVPANPWACTAPTVERCLRTKLTRGGGSWHVFLLNRRLARALAFSRGRRSCPARRTAHRLAGAHSRPPGGAMTQTTSTPSAAVVLREVEPADAETCARILFDAFGQ